jgi:dihydrofolate synthase/folylpolyglutamate synthase
MFSEICPRADSIVLTASRNPRAAAPVRLAELAAGYGVATSLAPDLASALQEARSKAGPHGVICVTGSLFVVAEAREVLSVAHIPTDSD